MVQENITAITYFEDFENRMLLEKTSITANKKRSFYQGRSNWYRCPKFECLKFFLDINGNRAKIPLYEINWSSGKKGLGADNFPVNINGRDGNLRVNLTFGTKDTFAYTVEIRMENFDPEDEVKARKKMKKKRKKTKK